MSPAVETLLRAAMTLTPQERAELIGELIVANSEQPLSPEWMEEIRRRSAEFDAGLVTPIPWEEVRDRADREIRGHG